MNKKQKTYFELSREKCILNAIGDTRTFKELVEELPHNFNIKNLRVSFIYDAPKEYIWENNTLVSDNNICDSEVRKRMKEVALVRDIDSKGDVILYPDD